MIVRIEWVDPEHDWYWFRLLGVNGDRLWLEGVRDQDTGDRHEGDIFTAGIDEILYLNYRRD